MQSIRFSAVLILTLFQSNFVFATDKVLIGTLSSFRRPEKLGEVFRDNDTDSFDDIESHIRQGTHLFAKKYCPREIVIKDYDTGNTVEGTLKAIKEAERDGVKALIGFVTSTPLLAVNKLMPQRRTPILAVMASHMEIARREPPTLQMAYHDEIQGKTLAETIGRTPEKYRKQLLLLTEATNPYSVSLSNELKRNLQGSAVQLREFEYATPLKWLPKGWEEAAFRSATAIVMTGEGREVLEVVSHLSKINSDYLLIGGDGWYRGNITQYLPKQGVFIPNTVTVGHWTPKLPDGDSQEFGREYAKKFKHDAGGTAGLANDAIKTICEVWKSKKNLSFDSFQGVSVTGITGTIHFDKQGRQDLKKPLVYWFSEGKYRYERY